MRYLIILNEAPYGGERTYNGLRLAGSVSGRDGTVVKVFLMGDAVAAAHRGQKGLVGYYNLQTMLGALSEHGGSIGVCGSCIDARGIAESDLVDGARRSSMEELTAWTMEADKVIVF
jgi:uncharacterized protein involved in oxidation of intracellular sulfur